MTTLPKVTLISLIVTLTFPVNGMMRSYSASISDSSWSLIQNTPTACVLQHNIPRYGSANFASVANKRVNLDFELDMVNLPERSTSVELRSEPPLWRPAVASSKITKLAFYQRFNGEVVGDKAWTMLYELEKGMVPTFYYQDWYSNKDQIKVALSAVNFAPQHLQFMDCVSKLLPYSYEDIAFTTLNYRKNTQILDPRSQKKLTMIQQFLKYEPELELVLIDSYTDSYGGRYKNEMLSKQRAGTMKELLEKAGIPAQKIIVNGYGEKRHIASNEKIHGRNANRRVVITMSRGY
ncbi:MAG: OmpA family protein [Gammaproteobacteria bacterium]|nr:OmpA family protein [Gammaproteobacteria bacterium]